MAGSHSITGANFWKKTVMSLSPCKIACSAWEPNSKACLRSARKSSTLAAARRNFRCNSAFCWNRMPKTLFSGSSAAAALDPENSVFGIRFQQKAELHLKFLRAAAKVEDFLALRRQAFEFGSQALQAILQGDKLITVFFQKFAPVIECEPAIALRQ